MTEPEQKTITKKELANRIAEATDQPKVVVKDILQRFLDGIIDELVAGNRLEFREFGVFEVRDRAPRRAQNPRTLEKVEVPAKRVVKFKVGRLMRDRVCDQPARKAAPGTTLRQSPSRRSVPTAAPAAIPRTGTSPCARSPPSRPRPSRTPRSSGKSPATEPHPPFPER